MTTFELNAAKRTLFGRKTKQLRNKGLVPANIFGKKMDSIAILKATGFSGADVKRIFLSIAVSIGLFGGCLGLILGFVFCLLIDQIPFVTAALPTITTYPVNYNPVYYIIGITFSIVTTYLAGYFPARKASKIDPVVIIRGK